MKSPEALSSVHEGGMVEPAALGTSLPPEAHKPTLSVVIPAFNAAERIEATVDHVWALAGASRVLRGTAALEVIVVDDGSTDGTGNLVDGLVEKYGIRTVRQENGGVSAARNAGIRAAQADIIAMLDVDDRWTSTLFNEVLAELLSNPTIPIVQGLVSDMWDEGLGPPYEAVNLGAAMFRSRVFDEVGLFDETLRRHEDTEWFLRCYDLRVPKTRIGLTTLEYLRRGDGLTGSAPRPDPLLVRVYRDARKRRAAGLAPIPPSFPEFTRYLGVVPSEADRRPAANPRKTAVTIRDQDLSRLDGRPISDAPGIRAFLCVRNELDRLPAVLDHHRGLGVQAFFVVDNDSSDGTVHYLLDQPDVHCWNAPGSFSASGFGMDWVEELLRRHGAGEWCLVVDADELLVLPPKFDTLGSFCQALDRESADAVLAVMVDLYPLGDVHAAKYQSGTDPLATCGWFDRNVWTTKLPTFFAHDAHPSYFGGVRQRVFGAPSSLASEFERATYYTLNKVPLFRFDSRNRHSPSFHWLEGVRMSSAQCALLHWKYTSDFVEEASTEVSRGEHWNGASQYRTYSDRLLREPALVMFDPSVSVKYEDSAQLEHLGIVRSIQMDNACSGGPSHLPDPTQAPGPTQ